MSSNLHIERRASRSYRVQTEVGLERHWDDDRYLKNNNLFSPAVNGQLANTVSSCSVALKQRGGLANVT